MRQPSVTDFKVSVPDVGDFVFARKTLGDYIQIRKDYLAIVGDLKAEEDAELDYVAGFVAMYRNQMVSCPLGWEKIDAVLPDWEQIIKIAELVRAKEDSFRLKSTDGGEAERSGAGENVSVVVPETVQPATE